MAAVPVGNARLGLAVVDELDREVQVGVLHHGDDLLEVVAARAADPEFIALDLRLDLLGALIADQLGQLLGLILGDALLQLAGDLVHLAGGARFTSIEDLQAHPALDEFVLEHLEGRTNAIIGFGLEFDRHLALVLDLGTGALEVESLRELLGSLVDRVVDLGAIELGNNVKTVVGHGHIVDHGGMSRPRAFLFDLDRTLVDLQTYTDYGAALQDLTDLVGEQDGADVPAADWDAPTFSAMAILVALAGTEQWDAADRVVAAHELAAIPQSVAMPGLDGLADAVGESPYAVVTLLPEDVARAVLAAQGVRVDVIIGRHPRIPAKPSGAGLLVAAERLGVPITECVMIGDSSWDHAAALDAGAAFIGVPVSDKAFGGDVPVADGLLAAIAAADTAP